MDLLLQLVTRKHKGSMLVPHSKYSHNQFKLFENQQEIESCILYTTGTLAYEDDNTAPIP
jgi:hypothetical protein